MDSLLPIATRNETPHLSSRRGPSPLETQDDLAFASELNRLIREEPRSSRPPPAKPSGTDEGGAAVDRESSAEAEPSDEVSAERLRDERGGDAETGRTPRRAPSDGADLDTLEAGPSGEWAVSGATRGFVAGSLAPNGAKGETTPSTPPDPAAPPIPNGAESASTEEQLNLRKLTRYLVEQASSGTARKPGSDGQSAPLEPRPKLEADLAEPEPPPEPEGELPPKLSRTGGPLESILGPSATAASMDGADALELNRPFDVAARFSAPLPSEPQALPRGAQLSEAAQRAIAEARQRMLQPGRIRDGQLSMTLNVAEASIPMRLRFSPDGHGGQTVAFLVSSTKDLRELRKLMPEIETALTELPVEVSDVNVDVDSFRDTPSEPRPGVRP